MKFWLCYFSFTSHLLDKFKLKQLTKLRVLLCKLQLKQFKGSWEHWASSRTCPEKQRNLHNLLWKVSPQVSDRIKMDRNDVPFHQTHSTVLNWTASSGVLASCQTSQTSNPFFYFSLLSEWQQDTKSLIQLWAYVQIISSRKGVVPVIFSL